MKKFVLRVLNKTNVLKYLNFTFSSSVGEVRCKIPVSGGIGIDNFLSISERWMIPVLKILIGGKSNSKLFLDVGANIGQTLLKVKSIDKEIQYLGIEPNPTCVVYLRNLISANAFINTKILPIGICNKTSIEKLQFYLNSITDESASIVQDFRSPSSVKSSIDVPVFRFSDVPDLLNTSKEVEIIKIDVEGAELEVLEELAPLWKRARPFILMEILPVYRADNVSRLNKQTKIEKLMSQSNYIMLRINKSDNKFLGFTKIDSIGVHDDINLCDYIFSPTERLQQLENMI